MAKRRQLLEALTYALQNTNTQIRVSLLTEIADYLPPDLKEEVQDLKKKVLSQREEAVRQTCIQIKYMPKRSRFRALKSLVHRLPPYLNLPPEALTAAKAMPSEIYRVEALQLLAPNLPPDLLLEALDIARDPNLTSQSTALALSALADKLPELQTEVVLEALAVAESIPSDDDFRDNYRSEVLIAIVDISPEALQAEVLQKALTAARGVKDNWYRAISLANLAHKLPEALRVEVLQEALDAAREEQEDWATAKAFSVLIPKLPPELLPEALTAARNIGSEDNKDNLITVLTAITAQLPEVLPEILAIIKNNQYKSHRVRTLIAIAPHLPPELLPEAFDIAKDIQYERDRIIVLIALASPISKMPKDELLPLWQTIKHWLSQLSRQEFAHHVLALAAVIHAIGGQEAVVEALMETQDVERWQS